MSVAVQRVKYSQAASTTVANILSGLNLQYLGRPSKITLWAAAYLAAASDQFSLSYALGADFITLVPAGSPLNVNSAGPQQLNDLIGTYAIPGGANMTLALTSDATVGTHTGVFAFQIES